MLWITFSPFGVSLFLIGHVFHAFFVIGIKKNNFSNDGTILCGQRAKIIVSYIMSIIINIIASIYSTPSTYGVTFALFIILYDLYYFNYIKKNPAIPCLYYPSLYISLIAIIINILHSPPSFDNIGVTEVIHLLYSPVGSVLTFLYIVLQIIFALLSYQGFQIASVLNTSLSFASLNNFIKLIGNFITLTYRIENQFLIHMFYPFMLSFIVSVILYFFAIKKAVTIEICGVYRGVYYFSYLVFQISSATLLFGEPMLLNPVQLGIFLSSAVLLVFSMFFMSCGAWSLFPSNRPRALYSQQQQQDMLPL